jgi:hypothetical protein
LLLHSLQATSVPRVYTLTKRRNNVKVRINISYKKYYIECHKSCKRCSGPGKGDCTSCKYPMFFASTEVHGNICVGNCDSIGLYPSENDRTCTGCHPACAQCYGPSNEECFDCNDEFIRVSDYVCDSYCYPENSYIKKGKGGTDDDTCECKDSFFLKNYNSVRCRMQKLFWA